MCRKTQNVYQKAGFPTLVWEKTQPNPVNLQHALLRQHLPKLFSLVLDPL